MTSKKQRSKKSEMEKAIQLGLKYGLYEINTPQFNLVFKPSEMKHNKIQSVETKPKFSASGIQINEDIPKEEIFDESEMLFYSTPFFNVNKQHDGEPA
jgi:hypothetical protein